MLCFTGVATELEANIPATNTNPLSIFFRVYVYSIYPVSTEKYTNVISKLKNTKRCFNQMPVKFLQFPQEYPLTRNILNCKLLFCDSNVTGTDQISSCDAIFQEGC